ncbi:MAG: DUF3828 domain-containing protein [Blastocatellia bacterium]|nr:DUF3828 domain-containing protein [Blastocatellia bacterium]
MNSKIVLLTLAITFTGCTADAGSPRVEPEANAAVAATPSLPAAAAGGEVAPVERPEAVITTLYKAHDAQKGPFFERSRAVIDKFFARPLADLIWKDEQRPNDQISAIGADPLYDGQDFEITKFMVGAAKINGEQATIPVTFHNFGESVRLEFSMLKQNDAWKISDIRYASGLTLLGIYRENAGGALSDPDEEPIQR